MGWKNRTVEHLDRLNKVKVITHTAKWGSISAATSWQSIPGSSPTTMPLEPPPVVSIEPTGPGFSGKESRIERRVHQSGLEKRRSYPSPPSIGVNPGATKPKALNQREPLEPRQIRRHREGHVSSDPERNPPNITSPPRKGFPHLWFGEQSRGPGPVDRRWERTTR
jgi:hypothetical protein